MTLAETSKDTCSKNPFLTLKYEPALESLGDDYYDEVVAAKFPLHILRWRNDALLPRLGLNPQAVTDEDFIVAFGKFEGRIPLLALRYHGYQFGEYNPLCWVTVEVFSTDKCAVEMAICTTLVPKVLVKRPTLAVAMVCSPSKAVYVKF